MMPQSPICLLLPIFVALSVTAKFQFGEGGDDVPVRTSSPVNEDAKQFLPELSIADHQRKVEDGKRSYEMMETTGQQYGVCWSNALEALHHGCKNLDEDVQARLGLSFTNCFLEKAGRDTYPCKESSSTKNCLRGMSDHAFQAYTTFFTHTQSICFFLANQLWQQNTEKTVHKLSSASSKVVTQLEHIQTLHETSIQSQASLNDEIMESRKVFEEFKKGLNEQNFIQNEMLRRFLEVKEFILSELSKCYTIAFYVLAMFCSYALTSTPWTSRARFHLFALFLANAAFERVIATYILTESNFISSSIFSSSVEIDQATWVLRKLSSLIALCILSYFALTYKDYAKINNKILEDIRQNQVDELRRLQVIGISAIANNLNVSSCTPVHSDVLTPVKRVEDSESDSDFSEVDCFSDLSTDEETMNDVLDETELRHLSAQPQEEVSSTSDSEEKDVPDNSIISHPDRKYNLRPRKQGLSFAGLKASLTDIEFAALFRKPTASPSVSHRHTPVIPKPFFSSDDDL